MKEFVDGAEVLWGYARERFPWHGRPVILPAAPLKPRDERRAIRELHQRASLFRGDIRRAVPDVWMGARLGNRLELETTGEIGARRRERRRITGRVAADAVGHVARQVLATFLFRLSLR